MIGSLYVLQKVKEITRESEFYKEYNWNNWSEIPILSKKCVIQNCKRIFSPQKNNKLIFNRTSGSSGLILTIPWAQNQKILALKKIWDIRHHYGINVKDPYITCHSNYIIGNKIIENKIVVDRNAHSFSKIHMHESDIEKYVAYMLDVKPTWLLLQPSIAYALGAYLSYKKIIIPSLKLIELTGERIAPEALKTLGMFFNYIPIINNYGMQEFFYIAYGENSSDGLEIFEDNVYVEIIDTEGRTVPFGVSGKIVVTGLINDIFPLVRYETGDEGRIFEKDGKLYLDIIRARSNDIFIYNGEKYDASIFFNMVEYLNSNNFDIRQFQCCYEKGILKCAFYSNSNKNLSCNVPGLIKEFFESKYAICFKNVCVNWNQDFIFSQNDNKIKYFIMMP